MVKFILNYIGITLSINNLSVCHALLLLVPHVFFEYLFWIFACLSLAKKKKKRNKQTKSKAKLVIIC